MTRALRASALVALSLSLFAGSAAAKTVTRTFTISASTSSFVSTGIKVPSTGVTIKVTGDGTCHVPSADDCPVGPTGAGFKCSENPHAQPSGSPPGPAGDDVPYGQIAGRIGSGKPFGVGTGRQVRGSGVLSLVYNDCGAPQGYSDNGGSFQVTVTYQDSTLTISGVVLNEDGGPAVGSTVSASGPDSGSARTGPSGAYTIEVQERGVYTVRAARAYCVVGIRPCLRFRKVSLPPSAVVNFAEPPLTVDVSITPDSVAAAGLGALKALIRVERGGEAVTSSAVNIDPNTGQTPRAVVCENGRRVWPSRFPDGSLSIAGFRRPTDSQGTIALDVLPGTQPGRWFLAGSLAGRPRAFDLASANFTAVGGGGFDTQALIAQVASQTGQRQAGVLFWKVTVSQSVIGRPSDDGSRDQDALLEWLAFLRTHGRLSAEFAPVIAANGKPGVVFYPLGTDATQLERHLRGGGAVGTDTRVLDLETAQLINAGQIRPDQIETRGRFPNLAKWESDNGAAPARFARTRPRSSDEFTFLGFPYPPPAASDGDSQLAARCLGGSSGMSIVAHSPVNLLLRDGRGRRFGIDGAGRVLGDIPGSDLLRDARTATYTVPAGTYTVTVTGTGAGSATLIFTTPGRGPGKPQVFTFTVRKGATGQVSFGPAGTPPSIVFAGRRVAARRGVSLRVAGVPGRVRRGRTRILSLTVRDQFGKRLPAAIITLRGAGVSRRLRTSGRGTARLSIRPPGLGRLVIGVSAAGHLPLRRSVPVTR